MSPGTLQSIAQHLALAVEPLKAGVADLPAFRTLLYRIAWDVRSLPPEYTALGAKVDAAVAAINGLGDRPGPTQVLDAIEKVGALYAALKAVQSAPDGVDPSAFLAEVARGLFDLLLSDYLNTAFPSAHSALLALDVVAQRYVDETPTRPGALVTRFQWDEIPKILADPASVATRVYGWGTDDVDFHRLAGHLLEFFVALNWPAYLGRVETELGQGFQETPGDLATSIEWGLKIPALLDNIGGREVEIGLALLELPAQGGKPAGLILQPLAPTALGTSFELTDELRLELRAGSDAVATFGVLLRPDDLTVRFPFQEGAALPEAGFGMTLRYAPGAPAVLLGASDASRLELKGAAASFALDVRDQQAELRLEVAAEQLTLVVAAGDLDGFLATLLGGTDLRVPVPARIAWSSRTGLGFTVGAGFAVSVYPHLALGPVVVDRLDLGVTTTVGGPPDLHVDAAVTLSGALGPVAFAVDAMGLRLTVRFQNGNAGPVDVDLGFKPPAGLGLAVDAGPITGGGFLAFDPAAGRYTGILQLQVYTVAVTAIGLLETRRPDGTPGFSLLILIAADIPPIQIGFGFTLVGVGGLLGLNRTLQLDAVRAGLQTGALDRLLFPADPIQNAPAILHDLETAFPAAAGRHLVGPTFKLTWGVPILLRAELGLFLELPAPVRLFLLGRLAVALPTEEVRIVELRVDFVGVLDVSARLLAVDATLRDSRVAAWPLAGDMAARIGWGADKHLVLALGGLNPHYTPPPGFPALRRLTLAFGRGDNPRITMQAYLALTPNSRQLGARAEVYAAAAGFNILGWVAFDALLTLVPFAFTADVSAGVALRRGTRTLAGVHLTGTLTGPWPMRAKGRACLSLFFFDICVPFDVTVGELLAAALGALDPWPLLRAAIGDARHWSTALLPGAVAVASVTAPRGGPAPLALVEPMGGLTLRQTVVPLNRPIERVGAHTLPAPTTFAVQTVAVGRDPAVPWTGAQDHFAPGHFHTLSDAEQLSRPSFEPMDAGVTVAGAALAHGPVLGTAVVYETIVVDEPWTAPRPAPPYRLPLAHQLTALEPGAARAPLRASGLQRFAPRPGRPPRVALADARFVVVSADDLAPHPALGATAAKGAALDALRRHEAAHPEDRGRFQVVALHDLEVA